MNKLICFVSLITIVGSCSKSSTPPPTTIKSVTIGTQAWMLKNLDVSTYRNGELIPKVTDPNLWNGLSTGAWCWYNNDSVTYAATYGKLYNWFAVNDPRGLAPTGWHIPSQVEWSTLSTTLGGDGSSGSKMKETDTTHWLAPNTDATNSSGFTGLPGGGRTITGSFVSLYTDGYWWSSTENNATNAFFRTLFYQNGNFGGSDIDKHFGWSVRCIRD